MSNLKILMNGIITENPTFVLLLGMCPTLGTTSSAINGMSMGLATMFVLICSNIVISALKNVIPDLVRPFFVQSKVSVVLGIKLSYGYKDLCFSFKIITSSTNATCLEKGTILFTSNNCFYQMCKRIL